MKEGKSFTPGPWSWYGSTYGSGNYYLATVKHGRHHIMSFRRDGTQGAKPAFNVGGRMTPIDELVRYDVDPSVMGKTAGRNAESVYREDFSVVDHPDARLIAAAPDLFEASRLALVWFEEGLVPSAPEADWDDNDRETMKVVRALRAALAAATATQPKGRE